MRSIDLIFLMLGHLTIYPERAVKGIHEK